MRDLVFVGFLGLLFLMAFKRPYLFMLTYCYVDIVSPQRLTYFMLNSVPISLIAAALAIGSYVISDDKRDSRFSYRQGLLLLLLVYCFLTTLTAEFQVDAWAKWNWVWKAMFMAAFIPLMLRTRLRIEGLIVTMILCASSIIIVGGIKTLAGGGGYGTLALGVDNNSGLYESSIISMVAVSIIPLILWVMKHGTIFPPEWRVTLFCSALIFACLLMPVGTEARTGLVCIAVLGLLLLRDSKRKLLYLTSVGVLGLVAIPFLPSAYSERMETMKDVKADESASTRIQVWKWTMSYAQSHPFGGGFDSYRANEIRYDVIKTTENASGGKDQESVATVDKARAFHSAYFELLGEQGYPGLFIWLLLHITGLFQMEKIRRRYKKNTDPDKQWISPLASAILNTHIICMVGALFVGIGYQPYIMMLIALEIGFATYVARRIKDETFTTLSERMRRPDPKLA